ncbi:MAG: hypothetical protein WD469_07550 [Paenibacillaceae bacterium]
MQQIRKPWLLFFYIWGLQWVASGILDFFSEASTLKTIQLITLLLAVISSLLILSLNRSRIKLSHPLDKQDWLSYSMLFPLFILIGSLSLLWFIAASDTFLILHVLRVLLLAFFYVLIGAFWCSELIWLGCWLFALIVIVSVWYLGYAPFVFEGMGGLSLLAGGWVLQRKIISNN